MSSSIFYRDNRIEGTNGTIEEILIRLIKFSPDASPLLAWALEYFRCRLRGISCDADAALATPAAIADWQSTMTEALEDLERNGNLTEYGKSWLEENRDDLIHIDREPPV